MVAGWEATEPLPKQRFLRRPCGLSGQSLNVRNFYELSEIDRTTKIKVTDISQKG